MNKRKYTNMIALLPVIEQITDRTLRSQNHFHPEVFMDLFPHRSPDFSGGTSSIYNINRHTV